MAVPSSGCRYIKGKRVHKLKNIMVSMNMCIVHKKGSIFPWRFYERVTLSVQNCVQKGKGLDCRAQPPLPKQNNVEKQAIVSSIDKKHGWYSALQITCSSIS